MLEDRYKALISNMDVPRNLVPDLLEQPHNNVKLLKKPILIMASACLCLFMLSPVVSAYSQDIYDMMYLISPEIAQLFTPVQMSCEDNGIRMEVVSVNKSDNEIQVCISLQDLEGHRVDETTDLYDSYRINAPFSTGHCSFSGYDTETDKAMFILSLEGMGTYIPWDTQVTFSMDRFLSGKMHYEDIDVPFSLENLDTDVSVFTADINGRGGIAIKEEYPDYAQVLVPGTPLENFPVDGIDITGIGYADGKLHIQTAVKNRLQNDNHGYFWLTDRNGNKIMSYCTLYFNQDTDGIDTGYTEHIFEIPQSDISSYRIQGEFWTSGMLTEGNWKVSFEI